MASINTIGNPFNEEVYSSYAAQEAMFISAPALSPYPHDPKLN
jgi:hypothetical protein